MKFPFQWYKFNLELIQSIMIGVTIRTRLLYAPIKVSNNGTKDYIKNISRILEIGFQFLQKEGIRRKEIDMIQMVYVQANNLRKCFLIRFSILLTVRGRWFSYFHDLHYMHAKIFCTFFLIKWIQVSAI